MHWDWMAWWQPNGLGELEKSRLGALLKDEYSIICNVFAHYAGVGKGKLFD